MAKVLNCSDLHPGCSFEARGSSEEEVLKRTAEHAETEHNVEMSPELRSRARNLIHDENARAQSAGS